jgi:hypothetical protein
MTRARQVGIICSWFSPEIDGVRTRWQITFPALEEAPQASRGTPAVMSAHLMIQFLS